MCGGPVEFPDAHEDCVLCLGRAHAEAALEGSDCKACEDLPIKILRARLAAVRSGGPLDPASSPPVAFEPRAGRPQASHSGGSNEGLTSAQRPRRPRTPEPPLVYAEESSRPPAEAREMVLFGYEEDDVMSTSASDPGPGPDRHQLSDQPGMLVVLHPRAGARVASLNRHFVRGSLRSPVSERSRPLVSKDDLRRKQSSVPEVRAGRKRARSVYDNGPAAKRACSRSEFTRRPEENPENVSISWCAVSQQPLDVTANGYKQGVTKKALGTWQARSLISKVELFHSFLKLVAATEDSQLPESLR
ncbi:tRNA-specific adenosine deaminase 1 [Labeo rohita]|uniref:tRNA-specific adenosine deaminase 1 n=1 Tax=Labeo rohita TaxID=84645 RepID=A0A498NX07_LABRO|nr:tRNA-specific adenosine deaminase 1 [Labeo rohita]